MERGRDMPCVNMNLQSTRQSSGLQRKREICERDSIPGGVHKGVAVLACSVVRKDHDADRDASKHVDRLHTRLHWLGEMGFLLTFDEVLVDGVGRSFGGFYALSLANILDHHNEKPKCKGKCYHKV